MSTSPPSNHDENTGDDRRQYDDLATPRWGIRTGDKVTVADPDHDLHNVLGTVIGTGENVRDMFGDRVKGPTVIVDFGGMLPGLIFHESEVVKLTRKDGGVS